MHQRPFCHPNTHIVSCTHFEFNTRIMRSRFTLKSSIEPAARICAPSLLTTKSLTWENGFSSYSLIAKMAFEEFNTRIIRKQASFKASIELVSALRLSIELIAAFRSSIELLSLHLRVLVPISVGSDVRQTRPSRVLAHAGASASRFQPINLPTDRTYLDGTMQSNGHI